MGTPVTTPMAAAEYNTWATPNNQPLAATAAGTALLNRINNRINANIAAFRNAAGILSPQLLQRPPAAEFLRHAGHFV